MLESYLPLVVFLVLAIIIGLSAIIINKILAPHTPNLVKNSSYECGFPPFKNTRTNFAVKYYLVAMLFILFDIEIVLIIPWAIVYKKLPMEAVWAMLGFVIILAVGFIYEWRKGILKW